MEMLVNLTKNQNRMMKSDDKVQLQLEDIKEENRELKKMLA